jgi:sec-independent protein translocase protein TatB
MFGVDSTELAVVAVLALIFIGPKDLPRVLRTLGYWVGRIRGMARHFTSGIESMVREAELEEMEKRWREENERIMRLHPANAHYPDPPAAAASTPPTEPADQEPGVGEPDVMPPLHAPYDPDAHDHLPPEQRPLP